MQEGDDPAGGGTTTTAEDDGPDHHHDRRRASPPSRSSGTTAARVECATLDVPLDYEDPDGEQIELYVVRTPASGDRIGALFVNPGGPGAERRRVRRATSPYVLPEEITEHFDIVGVDPRGVGGSTPDRLRVSPAELYGVDPTFEDAADEQAYLEVSEEYVDDCAREVRRPAPAPRHTGRRPRHGRRARRHGRRAAQLPRLQLRHRDRPGVRRPVPRPGAVDGARRRRRARSDRARVGRRAGRRLRDGPRPLRASTATPRRAAPRPATRSRRSRRCSPLAEEPGGIPADGRRPRRRPRRGQPRHQLRALLAEPVETTSATPWPTPSTATAAGSSTWPTATSTSAPSRSTSR